jgi:hypothetical protein
MRSTLTLCLCLAALSGCRYTRRAHRPAAAARSHWFVYPAAGVAARIDATRALRGALRVEGDRTAPTPWPASAFVACAHLADGTWRFATEDGTLYRADTFTGRLAVVGALGERAAALVADGAGAAVKLRSEGGLFVIDLRRDAWAVDAAGATRRLPLSRVLHGVFTSPRECLAVVEPGVLVRSTDGGQSFAPVVPPRGVALSVSRDDGGAAVHTTEGTWRVVDGALVAATDVTSPAVFNVLDGRANEALAAASTVIPDAPWMPGGVASNPDGTVSRVRGDAVVTVDPRTGVERARVAAPGEDCVLARAGDGLRAVCRHGAFAAVYARADGARTWTTLRDEGRDEPMGHALFDSTSRAWIVAAPCRRRADEDRHRVCYQPDAGAPVEVRLPFTAIPVAMRGAVALVIDGDAHRAGSTRAALVRGEAVRELWLPGGVASALTATLDERGALSMWDLDPSGEHVLALVRGVRTATGWTWTRRDAPSGTRRGVIAPGGRAIVAGATAGLLAVSVRGGAFVALPSPVEGAGEALALGMTGPWFCAGPWCRLGSNLLLSTASRDEVRAVARADEVPPEEAPRAPQKVYECHPDGAPSVSPDEGASERAFASPAGLALPPAMQGAATFHATADGWIARTDALRDGVAVVTLASLSTAGAARGQRSYALATPGARADAGTLRGAPGLWVREGASRLRFHPLEGASSEAVEETTAGCEGAQTAEGEVFRVGELTAVRGEDWLVDAVTWRVEERLAVAGGSACVASITGSAADGWRRHTRAPVRRFALQAVTRDVATARAWAAGQTLPQRCALRSRP